MKKRKKLLLILLIILIIALVLVIALIYVQSLNTQEKGVLNSIVDFFSFRWLYETQLGNAGLDVYGKCHDNSDCGTDVEISSDNLKFVDNPDNLCVQKEQREILLKQYICLSDGSCTDTTTSLEWRDTGNTRNICSSPSSGCDSSCSGKKCGEKNGCGDVCNAACPKNPCEGVTDQCSDCFPGNLLNNIDVIPGKDFNVNLGNVQDAKINNLNGVSGRIIKNSDGTSSFVGSFPSADYSNGVVGTAAFQVTSKTSDVSNLGANFVYSAPLKSVSGLETPAVAYSPEASVKPSLNPYLDKYREWLGNLRWGTMSTVALSLGITGNAVNNPQTVLYDFYADWCIPCKAMNPVIQALIDAGYPVQRVNIEQNRALAAQYVITSIPVFVMIVDGREVDRVNGGTTFARLERMCKLGIKPPQPPVQPVQATEPQLPQTPKPNAPFIPAPTLIKTVPSIGSDVPGTISVPKDAKQCPKQKECSGDGDCKDIKNGACDKGALSYINRLDKDGNLYINILNAPENSKVSGIQIPVSNSGNSDIYVSGAYASGFGDSYRMDTDISKPLRIPPGYNADILFSIKKASAGNGKMVLSYTSGGVTYSYNVFIKILSTKPVTSPGTLVPVNQKGKCVSLGSSSDQTSTSAQQNTFEDGSQIADNTGINNINNEFGTIEPQGWWS